MQIQVYTVSLAKYVNDKKQRKTICKNISNAAKH